MHVMSMVLVDLAGEPQIDISHVGEHAYVSKLCVCSEDAYGRQRLTQQGCMHKAMWGMHMHARRCTHTADTR